MQLQTIIAEHTIATQAEDRLAVSERKNDFLTNHLCSNRFAIMLVVIISIARSISGFLLTVIIGEFFMIRFQSNGSKSQLLSSLGIHLNSINEFFYLFAALMIVNFFTGFLERFYLSCQGEKFVKTIREKLFFGQINQPESDFNDKPFGNYLLRYSNDLKAIQNYLMKGVLGAINQVVFVTIGLLLLFNISAVLGCVVISMLAVSFIMIKWLAKLQKKLITKSRDARSNMLAFVSRHFSRFGKLKISKSEERIVQRFNIKSFSLLTANLSNARAESFIKSLANIMHYITIALVLAMIHTGYIKIPAGEGLIAVLVLMLMRGAVKQLLNIPAVTNKGKISIARIMDIVNK